MYKVYCDSFLIYDDQLDELKIFNPSVELELNKTGSFVFTVYSDHPLFPLIRKMKSIITVFQDGFLLFRGRVLDEEIGWYNEKRFTCEGELAFLIDSIQRPYDFTGGVSEFLGTLLANHNAQVEPEKQFTLGTVTVTDPNNYIVRSSIDYESTWDVITKKLLEMLGGFLYVRHENGVNYLDYLKESTILAQQKITFGKNLLDLKRTRKGSDIATAVIPLGAKLTDAEGKETSQRLTISDVNGGLDYLVDATAQAQFGFIVKVAIFDDITTASALMKAGQAQLNEYVNLMETLELSAADLATVDRTVQSFQLGTQVMVTSDPHGMNQLFLVSKLSIKLLDPAENSLVLGKSIPAFSEAVKGISEGQGLILQEVNKNAQTASDAVYAVEKRLQSSIKQTETDITSKVAETYYLKKSGDDLGKQVSSLSTSFSQTSQAFEMRFDAVEDDVITMQSYIRYEGGNIILGEVGNELTLKIENDRITFLDGYQEVAYFSNSKLYVTDGDFLNVLRIGNFAFYPRENGNLSFSKFN